MENSRKCRVCGVALTGHSRREYCRYCKRIVLRQSVQDKKDPSKRKVGSADTCRVCSKEYVVKSGNQRYCSECAVKVAKERSSLQAQRIAEERIKKRQSRRGYTQDMVS